ncbi:MAG: hypothetical protein LUE06_01330, partial [Oscillospiraceae bacterium]|nr:hypothetical protein [Oscillospiraceae bacterium]
MTKSKGARQVLAFIMALALALSLVPAISLTASADNDVSDADRTAANTITAADLEWEFVDEGEGTGPGATAWPQHYQAVVSYMADPVLPDLQVLNIYVPIGYFDEDGNIDEDAVVNGYTIDTAPIVYQNSHTGWMQSDPASANGDYLNAGFIHIGVGARGSTSEGDEEGVNYNKSPAAIVDLKAGVRFLRLNDDVIPGDSERIISWGASGGGATSSLLGATGNMEDYYPYLYEIGAAGIGIDEDGNYYSTIDDSVFAAQCFCPITDLDNADLAYSWVRYPAQEEGISATPNQEAFTFSDFQKQILQKDLSDAYIDYVNNVLSFDGLTLGEDGRSGTYYDAVMSALSDSLNNYLDYNYGEGQSEERQEYVETYEDFDKWGTYDAETGLVSITDLDAWVEYGNLPARNKNIPGFDTLAATAENDSFGYPGETEVHYSASIAQVMLDNFDEYMKEASETEQTQIKQYLLDLFTEAELKAALGDDLDSIFGSFTNNDERVAYIRNQAYLYNSLAILTEENPDVAQYWRIRVGTADYHTAYSVTFNLATLLEEQGADVDYALIWEGGHGGHEEIEQGNGLFADWVNEICAEADDSEDDSDPFDLAAALAKGTYAWELSEDGTHYALYGVNFETVITNDEYQEFNYYVPAGYVKGIDETTGQLIIDEDATINGYTAATAPIVFENYNVGWASGTAKAVTASYIAEGFIHVGCGSRSRDATNEDGTIITGKAPTAVVDLKAGVRYLRYNADVLPGDMDKIVSVGGSGAGQMSTILGASGDMDEYYPYLYETGAVGVEYDETTGTYTSTISDAVYATMAYCPIADINNADMAYAWMRYDSSVNGSKYDFTAFQIELEKDLAYAFCEYINSLNLKDEDGNALGFDVDDNGDIISPRQGSYYDKILENMSDALNLFAENTEWPYSVTSGRGDTATTTEYADMDAFLETYTDTSKWITKNSDGTYSITDMAGFLTGTGLERNKDIPGFDTLSNSAENTAFGTPDMAASHYSASVAAVLEENYYKYKNLAGFDAEQVDLYIEQANDEYVINQAYLMNATEIMLNVANGEEEATPSTYWRTRNGTADQHTSFTIAYNVCLAAMANGYDVDYSLVWAMTHGTNEGTTTGTFEEWVNEICKPDSGDDDEVVLTDFSTATSEAQAALADAATLRALGNYTALESGYYTYTANGNTAVLYVGEDAQTNEFLTIIAMPDGVTTAEAAVKYAIQEGWPEQMDHYGEYMVLLPAPEAGWGTDADADAAYLAACKPSSNLTTFYGCYYLVGYGAAAGPMQIYAASSPISISAQVYIDATGDVSEALAAAGESVYSYSTAPTEGNYVDSVSYKDVAIPTYFIGEGDADDIAANIAYWQAAAAADNLTTAYSDVEVAVENNTTSETDAATAEDLLNNFVRYESSTVYGNNLKERKPIADTENAYVIDWDWTDPATGYVWNREVLVYVGETAGEDAPVVYALHGATNSSNLFYNATSWTEVADELGYIIVFLNGTASSAARAGYLMWQTNAEGRTSAAPSETVPSELDYILSAIELVDSRFDTAGSERRYITGNSAGSMNSHQVAQTLSDYFTALGTTSGIIMSNGSTIGYEYDGTVGYTYKWDGIDGSNNYTKIETGLDTFFPAYTIMGTNDHWTAAVGYVDYDSLETDDEGNFVGIYPGSKSTKSEASEYNMPFRTQLYFLMRNGAVDLGDITYYDVLDAINGGVEDFAAYYDAYVKAGFEENMEITNEFNLGEPVDGIYSLDFVTEEGYYSEDAINTALENGDVDRYTTYTWYNDSGVPVYQWSANYTRSHEMTPDDEWLIAVTWFEHWTMKNGVYYYDGVAANAEDAEEPDDDTITLDIEEALAEEIATKTTLNVTVDGEALAVDWYAAPYVSNPNRADDQKINIYIPANATSDSPIMFYVNNSGWQSNSYPTTTITDGKEYVSTSDSDRVGVALSEGYIIVSYGARSRNNAANDDGEYLGHSPATMTDTKAAIRYLRYNAEALDLNTDAIVITGTSGGGALSTVIAASGNSSDFYESLYEIGAAGIEKDENGVLYSVDGLGDNVLAVIAYCPITDFRGADMAYEWLFYDTRVRLVEEADGEQLYDGITNDELLEYSADLKKSYETYFNGLDLVDDEGNALTTDNLLDHIEALMIDEFNTTLKQYIESEGSVNAAVEAMIADIEGKAAYEKVGNNWLIFETDSNGDYTGGYTYDIAEHLYFLANNQTLKVVNAFSNYGLEWGSQNEDNVFGSTTDEYSPFEYLSWELDSIKGNAVGYDDTGYTWDEYMETAEGEYLSMQIRMTSALDYLVDPGDATPATYWYVRHGVLDRDTSFAVESSLFYSLYTSDAIDDDNINVGFAWLQGHAGNYDVQEAYTWLDAVLNGTEETEGPDVTVSTSVSSKTITVNIDSDEEADFIIFLTNENGEAVEVKTVSGTSETVKFTGLTNGEEYTVTVTAVNSDGGETIVAETATPKSSSSGGNSSSSTSSTGNPTTEDSGDDTTTSTGTFSDVSTDTYYYDAVEWAVANGIT